MSSRTKDMLISQTDRNYCMKICVDIKHQIKKVILIAILADFENSRLIFCPPCLIKKKLSQLRENVLVNKSEQYK